MQQHTKKILDGVLQNNKKMERAHDLYDQTPIICQGVCISKYKRIELINQSPKSAKGIFIVSWLLRKVRPVCQKLDPDFRQSQFQRF